MYNDYATFGFMLGVEQDAITERAEQTARWMQAFREWRRKHRAGKQERRTQHKRNAYATAA
jgi:hypothetical protein